MAILLLADHDNTTLSDQTAKALSAAVQIGGDIDILVAGKNAGGVAEAAASLAGIRSVILVEDDGLEHHLAEPMAALVQSMSGDYDTLVAAATTLGKNVMPRVAALLDVMQLSEVIEVVAPDTFKRPIYAGNAIEVVQSNDPIKVLTVRGSNFAAVEASSSPAEIKTVAAVADAISLSRFLSEDLTVSDRPELGSAKIIVSGGRALGSSEKFKEVIYPLADKLGAAVGASRAAVDAGYAANDLQVGQTGKVVAPDLYIACGISGAIQHLAGMKDSRIIVAINKDEEAPIFQVADYGIVGDLFEILPQMESQL